MADGQGGQRAVPVQDWPSIRDAAQTLALAVPTVWRLIQDEKIDATRTRLGYLVNPASVAAYAEQRRVRGRVAGG